MARTIGPAAHRPRPSLKYLKPGSLARLRDNRAARSHCRRVDPFPPSLFNIEIPSALSQAEGDPGQSIPIVDKVGGYGFISFRERICSGEGPRCLTKKKLVAEWSVRLVKREAPAPSVPVARETVVP